MRNDNSGIWMYGIFELLNGSIDENDEAQLLRILKYATEMKDSYTRIHSERVARLARMIAEETGIEDVDRIYLAGILHDIGKIEIPNELLSKKGNLTDEEFKAVKEHPAKGREILSKVNRFSNILNIVEAHHERYDGTGYPEGLKGEMIPLEARIISVADAFDAMTSKRVYRDSMSFDAAIDEIRKGENTQFDPGIAEVFIKLSERLGETELFRQMEKNNVL